MFLLPFDVVNDKRYPLCIDRAGIVARLPSERCVVTKLSVKPSCRLALDLTYGIGKYTRWMHLPQHMYVIVDTIDRQDLKPHFISYATDQIVQPLTMTNRQGRQSVLCGKDQVNEYLCVAVHDNAT